MASLEASTNPDASSDIEFPALLAEAKKLVPATGSNRVANGYQPPTKSFDSGQIPSLGDVAACNLEPDIRIDLVMISEFQAFQKGSVNDRPTMNDISFIRRDLSKTRTVMFEVETLVDSSKVTTVSSEANRLLTRLIQLKANDLTQTGAPRLKDLLPENYRILFVARGVGATIAKECLMQSRSSTSPLIGSVWESCRGIICINPLDGNVIQQMRQDNIPKGVWRRYKASWWAGWWSSEKKRIAKMSAIIDEAEQIETDYHEIAANAPPRYSLLQLDAGQHQIPARWKDVEGMIRNPKTISECLKTWSKATQTAPVQWPAPLEKGSRLLSLDGGGVKGLSGAMILDAVMKKVRELETPPPDVGQQPTPEPSLEQRIAGHGPRHHGNELLPVNYFDLAGGTSTGGLMGVMLFRLGMCGPCTIDAYKGLASQIFPVKIWGYNIQTIPTIGPWLGSFILKCRIVLNKPQFDGRDLENATQKLTVQNGENKGKETKLMEDPLEPDHGKM